MFIKKTNNINRTDGVAYRIAIAYEIILIMNH